jgi:hypothetical protein
VRNGQCAPPPQNTCPPGQIQLPNGRCIPPPQTITCPRGQTLLGGSCCPIANVHNGQCIELPKRPPILRRFKVDEPTEPTRHITTFHTRIPPEIILEPHVPPRSTGGHITAPQNPRRKPTDDRTLR